MRALSWSCAMLIGAVFWLAVTWLVFQLVSGLLDGAR